MAKRKRRTFTKEFKAETVRLVRKSGKSVPTVARELDLTETALRSWVRQAEVDAGRGMPGALTTAEREELGQLCSRCNLGKAELAHVRHNSAVEQTAGSHSLAAAAHRDR